MTTRTNPLPLLLIPFIASALGTAAVATAGVAYLKANPPGVPDSIKDDLEDSVSSGVSGAVIMSGLTVGLLLAVASKLGKGK